MNDHVELTYVMRKENGDYECAARYSDDAELAGMLLERLSGLLSEKTKRSKEEWVWMLEHMITIEAKQPRIVKDAIVDIVKQRM